MELQPSSDDDLAGKKNCPLRRKSVSNVVEMPETQSDEALLGAFVKSHDEQAFRCLSERYSGLIFHTALRTLNDRTLAEDVAQRVLGVLAKKAPQVARGNAPLAAWLHRTTILEAKSARRIESRHHRKKESLMRAPADSPDSNDPAWKDALPHLDAAIDMLPEADRHVLLLHYVNEMTFPEIATRVGKSAAAVQKQSRRALETLQRILGRRGVTLSLSILTAGLTTEMAKAGPVLLLPAFSSLGKTTTSVIVVKKSTLAALGTTLLLCGIPLARQHASISELKSRLSAAASASPDPRISSRPGNTKNLSMVERLARDLKAQDRDVPRYLGAVDHIEALSDEELIGLIKETALSSMPSAYQELVFAKLVDTLAIRNPELALNTLLASELIDCISRSERARNQFIGCLRILSERDGRKSLEWFRGHLDAVRSIRLRGRFPEGYLENEMRPVVAYGLLNSDPNGVLEVLTPLPPPNLKAAFEWLAQRMDPFPVEKITGFVRGAREMLSEKEASEATALLVSRQIEVGKGAMPYKSVDALLASGSFSPSEIDAIAKRAGALRIINHSDGLEAGIVQYKAWLEAHLAEGVDRKVGVTLGHIAMSWPEKTEPAYQAMLGPQNLERSDEMIVGFLITSGKKYDETKITQLTRSLSDQDLALDLISRIKKEATE